MDPVVARCCDLAVSTMNKGPDVGFPGQDPNWSVNLRKVLDRSKNPWDADVQCPEYALDRYPHGELGRQSVAKQRKTRWEVVLVEFPDDFQL